MTSSKKP